MNDWSNAIKNYLAMSKYINATQYGIDAVVNIYAFLAVQESMPIPMMALQTQNERNIAIGSQAVTITLALLTQMPAYLRLPAPIDQERSEKSTAFNPKQTVKKMMLVKVELKPTPANTAGSESQPQKYRSKIYQEHKINDWIITGTLCKKMDLVSLILERVYLREFSLVRMLCSLFRIFDVISTILKL
ncbi:UNKNOWN [Stylonychia lemnae]|uniref:Uncharacterized protein n=1 Tax=Stylonychia lemnae TaxID=5949 RepID=A0A078AZC9_STYLE|nr:UNKNOWN [Stylonychia lemnae]|eukprot:CDW87504.1 UNKNOWN [Stylonychia lemnae]